MKSKIGTAAAFSLLGLIIAAAVVLTIIDRPTDVFPDENTMIELYGESHGQKMYYDIEFETWQSYYEKGCRDLFVELPFYTAEFLNLWMKEESDAIIDELFEDIKGTQSGNEYYYEFWHEIKEACPETVFHGTDVGHQFDTTGARYLKYLEENGLAESENYALAKENIRQGEEFHALNAPNGIAPEREAYMVSNFIAAYDKCGGRIMGIYGSYHTDPGIPELMAGRIRSHYGDIVSGVSLTTLVFNEGKREPYSFGFCVTGCVFLVMLFVPNIIWANRKRPEGYEEAAARENKVLLLCERIGEVTVSASLVIFPAIDPYIRTLPEGTYFEWKMLLWLTAAVLMILYECYWIRYFRSPGTMKDQYSSFAGFPVAGASLPVISALLLGLYSGNLIVICAGIVLGIGHIGIHLTHMKEAA